MRSSRNIARGLGSVGGGGGGKVIIGRSALNLVVSKQLAAALDDTGSTMTVQLAEMIRGHNTGIISTQIVEDLIGV